MFKAKTELGFVLKVLFEIIQQCVKDVTLSITSSGIDIIAMDEEKNVMINTTLLRDKFIIYQLSTSHINISIDTSHLHRILKPLKKKDTLKLFIDDSTNCDNIKLRISTQAKEGGRVKTSFVPIKLVEPTEIGRIFPSGHDTVIFTEQFHKICKDLNNNTFNIKLKILAYGLCIESDSIYQTMENISVYDEDDIIDDIKNFEGKKENRSKVLHECTINSALLVKFMKLSRLSTKLHIHHVRNCLIISMPITGIGNFQATIKTNEMIEIENSTNQ